MSGNAKHAAGQWRWPRSATLACIGCVCALVIAIATMRSGTNAVNAGAALSQTDLQLIDVTAALKKNPGDVVLRFEMANLLIDKGEVASAEAIANALVKELIHPRQLLSLGRLYMRIGNNSAAIAVLEKIPNHAGVYEATVTHLAEARFRFGFIGESLAGLADSTNDLERIFIRARIMHAQGKIAQAISLTDQLIDRNGDDPRYWQLRGDLALAANDPQKAMIAADEMRRIPAYKLNADLIDINSAIYDGRFDDASLVLTSLLNRYPGDHRVRKAVALLAANRGDFGQAAQLLDSIGSAESFDVQRSLQHAGYKIAFGDMVQANAVLKQLRNAVPDNWLVAYLETQAVLRVDWQSDNLPSSNEKLFAELTDKAPTPIIGLTQQLRLNARQHRLDEVHALLIRLADYREDFYSENGGSNWGSDILFGRHAAITAEERRERDTIGTMISALTMARDNQPRKALGLLVSAPGDALYASAAKLIIADLALDSFEDERAAEYLAAIDADNIKTGATASAWQTRIAYRLALRQGDAAAGIEILQTAIANRHWQMADLLLAHYLNRDQLIAARTIFNQDLKIGDAALFRSFIDRCIDNSKGCTLDVSLTKKLVRQATAFGPDLNAQLALVRLYEYLENPEQASNQAWPTQAWPTQAWAVQRDIFRVHGATHPGQTNFAALIAAKRNWKQAASLLDALTDQRTDSQSDMLAVRLMEQRLIAKRERQAIKLAPLRKDYADHPLLLAALAEQLIEQKQFARKSQADADRIRRQVEPESRHPADLTDLQNPVLLIMALRTIDGNERTRARLAAIMTTPELRAYADEAITALASLTEGLSLADELSIRQWAYLRSSPVNAKAHAIAYAQALAASGYHDQAVLIGREVGFADQELLVGAEFVPVNRLGSAK